MPGVQPLRDKLFMQSPCPKPQNWIRNLWRKYLASPVGIGPFLSTLPSSENTLRAHTAWLHRNHGRGLRAEKGGSEMMRPFDKLWTNCFLFLPFFFCFLVFLRKKNSRLTLAFTPLPPLLR